MKLLLNVIVARKVLWSVLWIALFLVVCILAYRLVRHEGPRPVALCRSMDLDGWVATQFAKLKENAATLATRGVAPKVRELGAQLGRLDGDAVRFYMQFYELIGSPTHFLITREKTVLPLVAPKSVVRKLCPDGGDVDDAALNRWRIDEATVITAARTQAAALVAALPAGEPSRVVHGILEADLFLNRYLDDVVQAYNTRKSRGRRIQFTMLRTGLKDTYSHVLKEVGSIWATFGRSGFESAIKQGKALYAYYTAPEIQSTMRNLPSTLSKGMNNPKKNIPAA